MFNKSYPRTLDEKLKEQLFNTCTFSMHGNNKFILLILKDVYRYEYSDDLEKLNENEIWWFYSHLNTEDITDADYVHAKKNCKDFKI